MKEIFIERWKANDWAEKDEFDNQEFSEVEKEKEIYLKMFPESAKLLNEEDIDEQDNIGGDNDEVTVGENGKDD